MTPAQQLAAQAAQWQAAGRPDMAAPLFEASLQQDPTNVMARWQLADCLSLMQQPDQATVHYLQVAQAHALMGRQPECLGVCERIIQIAPHAFVYTAVGPTVRRIGSNARTVCARAAEAHLRAGRQTEGLQILRLGAELDATSPEVRLQLARIYKSRGMVREAVEAMADAGDLLMQSQRFSDYARVAELLLTLDPEHLDTLRELPRAYIELRRPHDAVRMLSQLTRVSPGDIVGYEVLAQAFAFIGHTEKALSVLERLVDELAVLGRGSKADAVLENARRWRPNDLGFMRALKRMEVPKPASARSPAPPPQDMPPEGTVVLDISDLVPEQSLKGPAPSPAPNPSGGRVEVEGTLSLDLDELMRHERQKLAARGIEVPEPPPPVVTPPPPPPQTPLPSPDDVEISMSLDASALIEALANDVPLHELAQLAYDDDGDEAEPEPPPAPAPAGQSPWEDDDDQSTMLTMKALTAEDVARSLARSGAASPPAPVRGSTPSAPPPGRPSTPPPPPRVRTSTPPPPPPARAAPPPPRPVVPAPHDEDAPTMANLQALTAADLARGLAQAATAEDDDAMTLAMEALTPEDIARALRKQGKDGGPHR
ncbi:tetratricopeptide repeat protein [Paraliomyxa miuraensis]|uniref:tetratricopeptide repeat protein n=1 Tax=Paraliomyxa miuraensis TaxID=376150 RepID=UPI002259757A|nr:tetratricopeptide repeat protein [Paraliomyxa miuraensis]MCX4242932.1 tetratricopeptide repeat protein [Paraliomyxa miuraensis]